MLHLQPCHYTEAICSPAGQGWKLGTDMYLKKAATSSSLMSSPKGYRKDPAGHPGSADRYQLFFQFLFQEERPWASPSEAELLHLLHFHKQSTAFSKLKKIALQNDNFVCSKLRSSFGVGLTLLPISSFAKLVSLPREPQKPSCRTH